ncbi:MAG: BACON domain-containing protein [Bacteroidales bacterium]
MIICICPLGAMLPDIPTSECPVNFGQIQKIIIQRKGQPTGGDPTLLATWTALMAAIDDTKAVISPFISAPVLEPGAEKTYGGGNATIGGIPLVIGRDPSKFTSELLMASQETIKALKDIQCDSIQVYLVNEVGQIGCLLDPITGLYKGIPVRSFFVGDLKLGGFEEPDKNVLQFYFEPNWSDDFLAVVPSDFDALTIRNPYLTVTPEKLTAVKEGEIIDVAINSNTAWTVTLQHDWITVGEDSGTGTDTIEINVESNGTAPARTNVVTVTAGNIVRTFTISQAGTPGA